MRLIAADLLEPDADYDDGEFWAVSIGQIQDAPTIEERKTGKWIEKDVTCIDDELDDRNVIDEWQAAKCSVCGKWHTTPYLYSFDNYAYCPNCGAKMNGGEEND